MSGTNVSSASSVALKVFSAALFAQALKEPTPLANLSGPSPTQGSAEAVIRQQTSEHMPIVQITDLAQGPGDRVAVDAIGIVKPRPIMGDRNAEGRGAKIDFVTQEMIINMATLVIDAGGKMSQKRTYYDLMALCMSQLRGAMPRMRWQRALIHLAGARGYQDGQDWIIPLETDAEYTEMMVNTVMAPTYNRHYVVDGAVLVQGGQQLGSVDSTDRLKLSHLDAIAALLDEMPTKMAPIRLAGDPVAMDDPIKGVLMVDPLAYDAILTDNTANYNIRQYQAAAIQRASYGNLAKHPLFAGSPMLWNGVLIKKMSNGIRFPSGANTKVITAANRLTAVETTQAVAAMGGNYQVSRSILLGAQALASAMGSNRSTNVPYSILENSYNFGRAREIAGEFIGGELKLRFPLANASGDLEPTDFGALIIDSVTTAIA
jgi:hypothetical protein